MKACGKIINRRFYQNGDNMICGKRNCYCEGCTDKEDALISGDEQ